VVLRFYDCIIWRFTTFASLVWWPSYQTANTKKRLSRLQRLACLRIAGAMRTSRIGAMEALTGFSTLELVIQCEAKSAAHCPWSVRFFSYLHRSRVHSSIFMWLERSDPIFNMGFDVMRPALNIETKYMVTMLTREEWTREPGTPPVVKGLVWCTDRSSTMEGNCVGVYGQYLGRRLNISLGKRATVF